MIFTGIEETRERLEGVQYRTSVKLGQGVSRKADWYLQACDKAGSS